MDSIIYVIFVEDATSSSPYALCAYKSEDEMHKRLIALEAEADNRGLSNKYSFTSIVYHT